MLRYLLDANVFVVFQRAGRLDELAAASGVIPMALVEEVYDELLSSRGNKPKSQRRETAAAIQGSTIELRQIMDESPEATLRDEILKGKINGRDRGESASIALASHDTKLLLVTEDWVAIKLAYRELHGDIGRVIRLYSFIRLMVERGALPREVAIALATAAKQESNLDPPRWWAKWATP